MRYRIEDLPARESIPTTEDMYLFTVVLGFFIGIILTWLGIKGRQIWLTVWSIGLIFASIAYVAWVALFSP